MAFDLRKPVGLMFILFGTILIVIGLTSPPEVNKISLGINMNLWWGIVDLVFGIAMYAFSCREKKRQREGTERSEGDGQAASNREEVPEPKRFQK